MILLRSSFMAAVAIPAILHLLFLDLVKCQEPVETIYEILQTRPTLSTLAGAIAVTGLDATFSGDGPFTLLAPTDDAFNALGLSQAQLGAMVADGTATTLLKGHAASGTVLSTEIFDGQVFTTLSGQNLTVSFVDGGVTLTGPSNAARVTIADIKASNGVIHVIDAVITLPEPEPLPTIYEILQTRPTLSTLAGAIAVTGLDATFSGDGPLTLLAPTNYAFENLGLSDAQLAPLIADGTVTTILKGHAASGTVLSTEIFDGQVFTTLSGQNLTVSFVDGGVTLTGPSNAARVTIADIKASNGVIHVIDAVITLPEQEPVTFKGCYDSVDHTCKCETNYCGETECLAGGRIWAPSGCPTECVCTPATEPPTQAPTAATAASAPPASDPSDDSSSASDLSRMAAMLVPGLLLMSLSYFA